MVREENAKLIQEQQQHQAQSQSPKNSLSGNDAPVPESEVKAGFQAMLEELKVNSRPHLTTLTILAGEYRQFAKQVL